MLVLSRKVGERIVIGDNITLVVSRVSGNRVAIGIEAPPEMKILRGEMLTNQRAEPAQPAVALTVGFVREADAASASVPRLAK